MAFLDFLLPNWLTPSVALCRLLTIYQVSTGRLPTLFWVAVFLSCLRELLRSKIAQSFLWGVRIIDDIREILHQKFLVTS